MIKIDYSLEVEQAIKNNDPLVALESTIITHGMELYQVIMGD